MKKPGRPLSYTPELAAEICERLAAGEPLIAICRDDSMPNRCTVQQWVTYDVEEFSGRYARAREIGLEHMADELVEISDDGRNDWMDKADPDNPGYQFNGEHSQRSKLRVDTRKWLLSKLAPKKYGDKSSMELTGADGGPLRISDTERADKIAALLALAHSRRDVVDLV